MKPEHITALFLIASLFVALPPLNLILTVEAQESGNFGNSSLPNWLDVTVKETSDFVTVDNADGFVFKFRKGNAGYNEIWQDGSLIVEDERWRLEYEFKIDDWRMRGEPQSVSWERLESYHVVVKRFYMDYEGTTFNVTYSFYGGFRPKITVEGIVGQADTYRLVWKASGINKTHVQDEPSKHHVKFWNESEEAVVFDYSDVYESFGDIVTVEVEEWANSHKLNEIFNIGFWGEGEFRLDPNFGYETIYGLTDLLDDTIKGAVFTITEAGTADNMTVALRKSGSQGSAWNVKCAIYKHSDLSLEGSTEQRSITPTTGFVWYTFDFAESGPSLTADTEYVLVVWANNPSGNMQVAYGIGDANQGHSHSIAYTGTFPNPLVPSHTNHKTSIYCTYSTGGGGDTTAPTYSNIAHNTTLANYPCNFTIDFADETGLSDYYFSSNNTGTWSNGTLTSLSGTSDSGSDVLTLNSTVGQVVGYRWYVNDTSNNWNTTAIQTLTTTDGNSPTFSSITANTTQADASVQLNVTISDNDAVSHFIYSWNNTGTWANQTTTAFSSNPCQLEGTWNSTIGNVISVKAYANDTSDNWAVSSQYDFTLTDSISPTVANVGANTTLAGDPVLFYAEWSNLELSGYIFGTNQTGSWVNATWIDEWAGTPSSGWSNVSETLNSTVGLVVGYRFYANDTSDNWGDSGIYTLTITSDYYSLTLQAKDSSGVNLPRTVTFHITFPNATENDYSSDSLGQKSLTSIPQGSYTILTKWGTHVTASSSIDVSENTTLEITTKIARLNVNDGANYILISLNNTSLTTPVLSGEADIFLNDVSASGSIEIKYDHANWRATDEPDFFESGASQYNRGDGTWSWASSIFTFTHPSYSGTQDITLSFVESEGGGGGGGGGGDGYIPSETGLILGKYDVSKTFVYTPFFSETYKLKVTISNPTIENQSCVLEYWIQLSNNATKKWQKTKMLVVPASSTLNVTLKYPVRQGGIYTLGYQLILPDKSEVFEYTINVESNRKKMVAVIVAIVALIVLLVLFSREKEKKGRKTRHE